MLYFFVCEVRIPGMGRLSFDGSLEVNSKIRNCSDFEEAYTAIKETFLSHLQQMFPERSLSMSDLDNNFHLTAFNPL